MSQNDAAVIKNANGSTNQQIYGQIPACSLIVASFSDSQQIKNPNPIYTHRSGKKVKANMEKAAKKKAQAENFKSKHELKTPRGTRDFGPEQMAVRDKVLDIIINTFKRHGAVTIDTPVFELRKVLLGKYGEECGKLVYDLDDQEGEIYSLRYDLTVPFARYLALNKIEKIKRYQIAKVYRRDQPVMTKGRYREFYQCDFDIAGQGESMVQEAECLKIIDEVLSKLDLGQFEIRVNHRQLLEAMFKASGIPPNLFKTVSSSVDKLDKQPWAEIREELINEKGLNEQMANALGEFVRIRDMNEDWENAALFDWFYEAKWAEGRGNSEQIIQTIRKSIDELKLLFKYSELFGCPPSRTLFYPSLARGLDYYTGVIYEVVMKEFSFNLDALSVKGASNAIKAKKGQQEGAQQQSNNSIDDGEEERTGNLGSVAAGGRYDKLVGMFLNMGVGEGGEKSAGKRKRDVPCVGVSFGIERLFAIMEMKMQTEAKEKLAVVKTSPTQVFVGSIKTNNVALLLQERMKICAKLWEAGIRAETSYKANPKLLEQFQFCEHENTQIPWLVMTADEEMAQQSVKLRCVATREEMLVKLTDLVPTLLEKLAVNEE